MSNDLIGKRLEVLGRSCPVSPRVASCGIPPRDSGPLGSASRGGRHCGWRSIRRSDSSDEIDAGVLRGSRAATSTLFMCPSTVHGTHRVEIAELARHQPTRDL